MTLRVHDPEWFVPRLKITDRQGAVRPIRHLMPEQMQILAAIRKHRKICVLKPRQMGCSTVTQAWAFHYGWSCPDPVNILTLTHEHGAALRMNRMLRGYYNGLPRPLRGGLLNPDNAQAIGFGHNGATLRQSMAGGRGQGRSDTFQIFLATEMGKWPKGSASTKSSEAEGADREVFNSVLATMHKGPHYKVIVESTADGPSGIFYDTVLTAREDPEWAFLFFRWFDFPMYRERVPVDWKRDDEEEHLHRRWGVTDEQLAWRRMKLVTEKYTRMRFMREYPSKWDDPFILSETTWFDGELIDNLKARVPRKWKLDNFIGAERIYHEAEPGRRYFIGMDTSGGVGKDDAVILVLRDDYEIAAVWATNRVDVHGQANMGAKLSARYNGAVVLCEENKYGAAAIERMEKLGVPTWRDDNGKNFSSQGIKTSKTKATVYSYARARVNDQLCCSATEDGPLCINDETVLEQMGWVRENEKGNIEAPDGYHDDHVDAYVLALWCGRWHYQAREVPRDPQQDRVGRLLRMGQ